VQSALAGIGGLNGGGHRRRRTDVNRAVCAGEWRAGSPPRAQPALDACDGGGPGGEKAGQQREQAKDLREACPVGLEAGKRSIDDLLAMLGHVHEDERQDPDGEYCQRDAQLVVDAVDAAEREAQVGSLIQRSLPAQPSRRSSSTPS